MYIEEREKEKDMFNRTCYHSKEFVCTKDNTFYRKHPEVDAFIYNPVGISL